MLHSQDAAQDVVQEAFLSLWRTDAYRSEKGSLRNFVLTITRNRAIDVLRKDRPRSAQERSDDTAAWILSAADHNQVAPAQRDSQQHLRAALRSRAFISSAVVARVAWHRCRTSGDDR
jgi:RNA polymerase sigma-70 factor (ECF subfamily)